MTGLKWTRKTLAALTRKLQKKFQVGHSTVARLLKRKGYALARQSQTLESASGCPTRPTVSLHRTAAPQVRQGEIAQIISVDTKKKELIGTFKNAGRTWRRKPLDVFETDFPQRCSKAKRFPMAFTISHAMKAMSWSGTSHETPAFAIAAIRRWWLEVGCGIIIAGQNELLIQADGGGANGNRCWLWKWGLQQLADEFHLTITVTHYPTGASKWNPIEHRLFCRISGNWAGQPLISFETVLKFIRTTRTETGLRCQARLDRTEYETGLKITPEQKQQINLQPHRTLPQYNYTIRPHTSVNSKTVQVIYGRILRLRL